MSHTTRNPFLEDHPVDSLRQIGDGLKFLETMFAVFSDLDDVSLTRRDNLTLARIVQALRLATDHEAGPMGAVDAK